MYGCSDLLGTSLFFSQSGSYLRNPEMYLPHLLIDDLTHVILNHRLLSECFHGESPKWIES